jgi:RimJ/RimL family protein N-acetyltransferase
MAETLTTARLLLRRWRDADREPFQRLNADPRVMEFMPGLLTAKQSDEMIDRIEQHFERHGFGLYAAELLADRALLGFIGLSVPSFDALFMPAVEIGWRLRADYWGQGLATEGARAVVGHAFEGLGLANLVSFTVPENQRSRRVMEKLGMSRNPAEDFDHPRLPEGHPLRRHVLYRLDRGQRTHGDTVSLERHPPPDQVVSQPLNSLLLTLSLIGML